MLLQPPAKFRQIGSGMAEYVSQPLVLAEKKTELFQAKGQRPIIRLLFVQLNSGGRSFSSGP